MNEEAIFANAVAKASLEQRTAYLDEACGGDNEFRARVEELLDAHDRPDSLFDKPAFPHTTDSFRKTQRSERLGISEETT